VLAADGVPIAFEARGRGAVTIVFIHGWAGDRSIWRDQLPAFAESYRLVALDLPGHGESGAGREAWTLAGLAGDVQAVVEALDLKRAVLVGHSMGGPVALLAAPALRGRVIGIVGADTLHNAEFQWPAEQMEAMGRALEADFARTLDGALRSMFPAGAEPALVRRLTEKAMAADRKAVLGLFHEFQSLKLTEAFAAAKVPVRCINAAPRPPAGFATAVETNRKYADYDAVIMEGVGHFPMLERPAEFNARLRQVLAGLTAGPRTP
jgi:pimeloyl-ACP methyl ester carboxylesterase